MVFPEAEEGALGDLEMDEVEATEEEDMVTGSTRGIVVREGERETESVWNWCGTSTSTSRTKLGKQSEALQGSVAESQIGQFDAQTSNQTERPACMERLQHL